MNTVLKNEELVALYRDTRDERYLQSLISQNRGLLNIITSSYVESIPNVEQEDLISESYIPMLRAIEDFDINKGIAFSTFLKTYVKQHLNRLYKTATRKKRYTGSSPVSYDDLLEINKEGGDVTGGRFVVECEDMTAVDFRELITSLDLNEKERVAVNVLMVGGTKGEVAKVLNCTPATANYYFKKIKQKLIFAYGCI